MELATQQKWLKAGAGLVIASGLLVVLGSHPVAGWPLRMLGDMILWPLDGAQTLAASETRLLAAIAGGVLVGWGWALWLLAGEGMERAPDLARRIIVGSTLAWFVVDSAGSLVAGAPLNAALNLVYLELLVGPFWLARLRAKAA